MGGRELDQHVLVLPRMKPKDRKRIERAAALHIADRVAAEHPHLTAVEIAADPLITAGLRDLLAALGLNRKEQT